MKRIDGKTKKLWIVTDDEKIMLAAFITRDDASLFMQKPYKNNKLYMIEAFPRKYTFR